jgi:hypothetical protein
MKNGLCWSALAFEKSIAASVKMSVVYPPGKSLRASAAAVAVAGADHHSLLHITGWKPSPSGGTALAGILGLHCPDGQT